MARLPCAHCGDRLAPRQVHGCPYDCSGYYHHNCVRGHLEDYHPGHPILPCYAALTARGPSQDDSATTLAEQGLLRAELFLTRTRDPIAISSRQSGGGGGSGGSGDWSLGAQGSNRLTSDPNLDHYCAMPQKHKRGKCRLTYTSTSSPSSSASP